MYLHGVPENPILPARFYPPAWGYLACAAWLALYGVWGIVDAKQHRYRDEKNLVAGAVVLIIGVGVCAYLTLRGPVAH